MRKTLVVDLDGTLIRGDMLVESFFSALACSWKTLFLTLGFILTSNRAGLKRFLATTSQVDVKTLPYNQGVIDYIKAWRDGGGKAVLVTASDQSFADRVATHLGLFDAAHGSDGVTNLKGKHKAAFLMKEFGEGEFAYLGDSSADLPIWSHADRAITVNASAPLRRKVDAMFRGREDQAPEHLQVFTCQLKSYLFAMRPHQWLKNLLVFVPMVTAHQLDLLTATASLSVFVAYSLVASSVYLLNDLIDLSADRAHPRKCSRPLAAGDIPLVHGGILSAILLAAGMWIGAAISPGFFAVLAGYYLLTSAYSFYFKQRVIIDICMLTSLYTLRIIAGSVATGITLSLWLFAFSLFIFFALAAIKRQAELVDTINRSKTAIKGRGYRADDLPIITTMALGAGYMSVLVMALYLNSPEVGELYANPIPLWGVCCVLMYWITRAVLVTHRGEMTDDPIIYAIRNPISHVCFLLILLCVFAGTIT